MKLPSPYRAKNTTGRLLSTREVTNIIGRSPSTLRRWWKSGAFPEPILFNKRAQGFYEEDVLRWLKNEKNP